MKEEDVWREALSLVNHFHIWVAVFIFGYWRVSPLWSSASKATEGHSSPRRREKCHYNYTFLRQESSEPLPGDDAVKKAIPLSTAEERRRFLTAKKGCIETASSSLQHYIEWRTKHWPSGVSSANPEDDSGDWNRAARRAIAVDQESRDCEQKLPRVARMHHIDGKPLRDLNGNRIIQIIPGQMDERIVSLEAFGLAVALYIDLKLDRTSSEKITVLIDARGGKGWRNLNAIQLIPFIRHTSKLLLTLFPERLAHAQVFPVPPALGWVWQAVSACIDPLTREKISLLTGPARIVSPPPVEQMEAYMAPSTVRLLENARVNDFVHS